MTDPIETIGKLVALANDDGGSLEERRTAAMQAAAMIHRHHVELGSGGGRGEFPPFLRRFRAPEETEKARALFEAFRVALEKQVGRPSDPTPGRAELKTLLSSMATSMLHLAITPDDPSFSELADFRDNLPTVVRAFEEWSASQPVPGPSDVQASIMEVYGAWREPLPHADRIACTLHVPVPTVTAAIDALVSEQKLRRKPGQRIEVVRRRPKPKMTQEELFGGSK